MSTTNTETIIVYYDKKEISIYKSVAVRLGLRHGQTILTEAHFWEVLGANAEHGIMHCKFVIKANKNSN